MTKININININSEIHKKAKIISAVLGISLKDMVIKAIEDEIK